MTRAFRPRPRSGPIAGLACALLLVATSAGAQNKIAVLGVQAMGAPAGLAQRCSAALLSHIKDAGYTRVQGKSLVEIKLVFGCVKESAGCMAKVGENLKADKLLWGTLSKKKKRYHLALAVLDVATKKLTPLEGRYLRSHFAKNPESIVRKLVAKLLPAQIGMIKLTSAIIGAEVLLDGRPMGPINEQGLDMQVPAGSHTVQVRRDGYRTWIKRVKVGPGGTLSLSAKLEMIDRGAVTPPPPLEGDKPKKKSRTLWKVLFFSSLAVTVGFGAGILINGLHVYGLEDEKASGLRELGGAYIPGGCDVVGRELKNDPTDRLLITVNQTCSDGEGAANLQNIFVGIAAGTAVITAFFGYMAFIAPDNSEHETESDTEVSQIKLPERTTKLEWHLSPAIGPGGASLGFTLNF